MNKKISPLLGAGLIIFVLYTVIERFIARLPDWMAIPLLILSIMMIIIGGLRERN